MRYTRTPAEFHDLLEDTSLDIMDFHHVSAHMDRVVVRKKPEFADAPSTNCLPVAIFVTSYARLHLYSYMEQVEQLGHKILYCGELIVVATLKNVRIHYRYRFHLLCGEARPTPCARRRGIGTNETRTARASHF